MALDDGASVPGADAAPAPAAAADDNGGAAATPADDDAQKKIDEQQKQNALTTDQLNKIQADIAAANKLVNVKETIDVLFPEYQDNPRPGFMSGLQDLSGRYASLRRVRGDGNCFYRCFLFGYLEELIRKRSVDLSSAEAERLAFLEKIKGSIDDLVTVGYDKNAVEMFWEELVEALEKIPDTDAATLEATFQEENGVAEYMVWYCRALCAGFMKRNPDRFLPFILSLDDGDGTACVDIVTFCAREVEPMGRECEQIHIIALCEALGMAVAIEYLDGSDGPLSCLTLPEGQEPAITLLYRPGHYDILYAAR